MGRGRWGIGWWGRCSRAQVNRVVVRFSDVSERCGTVILTSQRLSDIDSGWRVGDNVEIPLSSGGKTIASITGIRYISGAGVGPEGTYLSLEFAGTFLDDVDRGGELLNLGTSK